MIDVSSAAKDLCYSRESKWLFDGDDPREDIPAFPPFIRFGKCDCNLALRTAYDDNIGIVSLDGCPSEVVGCVDLSRCVSLKSLDGMPLLIACDELVVPKMIKDGYTELNSSYWFSDDSFIPTLRSRPGGKNWPTVWIYDDGGYSCVHPGRIGYSAFELCFITDILRKNFGRVNFKVYGSRENTVLYDCSDDENLAEWIQYCDEYNINGYNTEDKEYLMEFGYFDNEDDDQSDEYFDDESDNE